MSWTEIFFFRFHLTASPLIILNPQFLYPVSHICMTAGIYMIVAITFERYCAVHYPLDYRQVSDVFHDVFQKIIVWKEELRDPIYFDDLIVGCHQVNLSVLDFWAIIEWFDFFVALPNQKPPKVLKYFGWKWGVNKTESFPIKKREFTKKSKKKTYILLGWLGFYKLGWASFYK